MSTGTQHFSLTEKDQINIFGLQATIQSGAKQIEYHSDGNPCKYYSVEDIQKLIVAAMSFVKYHTTYCNSLNVWINEETDAQTISEMYYGTTEKVQEICALNGISEEDTILPGQKILLP